MKLELVNAALIACLLAAGTAAASRDSHAPIVVTSDQQMLLPDALVGNGVRGGTGTAGDPWIISDWNITLAGQDEVAIFLQGIVGHVLVRDIDIWIPGDASAGLRIANMPQITLENVEMTGHALKGLWITQSSVSLKGFRPALPVEYHGDGRLCIRLENSQLVFADSGLNQACGDPFISAASSDVTIANVSGRVWGSFAGFSGPGAARLADLDLVMDEPALRLTPLANGGISGDKDMEISMARSHLEGFRESCFSSRDTRRAILVQASRLTNCGTGVGFDNVARATIEGTFIEANEGGLFSLGSQVTVRDSIFAGNGEAIFSYRGAHRGNDSDVFVYDSTFYRNAKVAKLQGDASIELHHSWADSPVAPATMHDPADGPLHALPKVDRPQGHDAPALGGLSVMCAVMAALVGLRRSRRP